MERTEELIHVSNINYPPSLPFTIVNMRLRIEPDFEGKRITGEEQLITCKTKY